MRLRLLWMLLAIPLLLLPSPGAAQGTVPIKVHLLDDLGQQDPDGRFAMFGGPPGSTSFNGITGDTIYQVLPGSWTLRLFPSLPRYGGAPQWQGSALFRDVPVTVDASSRILTHVWKRRDVTLSVIDEGNQPAQIPGSILSLYGSGWATNVPTGGTLRLPDTGPPAQGPLSSGYNVSVFPGMDGTLTTSGILYRREKLPVCCAAMDQRYYWKTAELSVSVDDQTGAPIPGSVTTVFTRGGFSRQLANGASLVLPVTEDADPSQSPIFGYAVGGYDFQAAPGIGGAHGQGRLYRYYRGIEHTKSGTSLSFLWPVARGNLIVLDGQGEPVPGASLTQPLIGTTWGCDDVLLPSNHPVGPEPVEGPYAGGYPTVALNPGLGGSYTLDVSAAGEPSLILDPGGSEVDAFSVALDALDPVAWWRFDDAPSLALDALAGWKLTSARGLPLAWAAPGPVGGYGAIARGGTAAEADAGQAGDPQQLGWLAGDDFTVEMLVRADAISLDEGQPLDLFSLGDRASLGIDPPTSSLYVSYTPAGGAPQGASVPLSGAGPLSLGTWFGAWRHLAFAFDADAQRIDVFLDGQAIPELSFSTDTGGPGGPNLVDAPAFSFGGKFWQEDVDEIALYPFAMTDTMAYGHTVDTLTSGIPYRFCDPGVSAP